MSIIDIDFRFVGREVVDFCKHPPARIEKILQWRKLEDWGQFDDGRLVKWTEWQDVRTEDE